MVQHKNTKTLFALKYINKPKCVKMKAVANIVQERRLLEEVSLSFGEGRESLGPGYVVEEKADDRSITLLWLIYDTHSKMMRIVSLSWILC